MSALDDLILDAIKEYFNETAFRNRTLDQMVIDYAHDDDALRLAFQVYVNEIISGAGQLPRTICYGVLAGFSWSILMNWAKSHCKEKVLTPNGFTAETVDKIIPHIYKSGVPRTLFLMKNGDIFGISIDTKDNRNRVQVDNYDPEVITGAEQHKSWL